MTGRTVEEAVEAALDQLGVAETDAEIVIVEEPKSGMFGLDEAVRNQGPRAPDSAQGQEAIAPTQDDTSWRRAGGQPSPTSPRSESSLSKVADKSDGEEARGNPASGPAAGAARGQARQEQVGENGSRRARSRTVRETVEATDSNVDEGAATPGGRQRSRSRGRGGRGRVSSGSNGIAEESSRGAGRGTVSPKEAQMSIETQQELATEFVREVVARFGIDATTSARHTEDDGSTSVSMETTWDSGRAQGSDRRGSAGADQDGRAASHRRSTRAESSSTSVVIANGAPPRCASSS